MDALYEKLEDFLDDADRADTLKYVQIEGMQLRAWFPSKWWLCVYEHDFKEEASKSEDEAREALKQMLTDIASHGFRKITIRQSPIIRGV